MHKLKDEIHDCDKCDLFPCSTQEEVSMVDICGECPVPCCYLVVVPLVPCEDHKLKNGRIGGLKMNDDGWCYYFNKKDERCNIYEKRPITCRVATCRFTREGKIPDEIKIIKDRRMSAQK